MDNSAGHSGACSDIAQALNMLAGALDSKLLNRPPHPIKHKLCGYSTCKTITRRK